jgi:tripartite-type tricarboxylate transporter receptor subunit TctC
MYTTVIRAGLRAAAMLLGLAVWMSGTMPAFAQGQAGFPDHPIRIVVPYPPGGPNDVLGRLLAAGFAEKWKDAAIVDNRPGGSGIIGGKFVTRSAPDGYTLLIVTPSSTTINVSLMPGQSFDPVTELAPVSLMANSSLVLVVNNASPVHSVKDLIAQAKQHPGKLTFGSPGIGSGGHLGGELFNSLAGVKMTHVAYKGGAPAVSDLLGGQIDMMFADTSIATPLVKSGKLRAIAVSGAQRSKAFPDLPTIAESGVPGYQIVLWFGLAAPAGTPPEIIAALNAETRRIVATPAYQERLAALGMEAAADTPQAFGTLIRDDIGKWAKIVKSSGARAE